MNKRMKERFIADLCNSVRDKAIENASQMPENWDGHELRQYLADKFSWETTEVMKSGSRRKMYKNTIATTTL